jgi:hypothetical protein
LRFARLSTCAIGTALCLGFHLKGKVRFLPPSASGLAPLAVSLSTFHRDYLFSAPATGMISGRYPPRDRNVPEAFGMARPDVCRLGIASRLLSGDRACLRAFLGKTWTDALAVIPPGSYHLFRGLSRVFFHA